jgi:hypothetical protein
MVLFILIVGTIEAIIRSIRTLPGPKASGTYFRDAYLPYTR